MRWHIEDFKGVKSAQIDLHAGKTIVLTGVNSSGKSSIIQSLLMVAQSLYGLGPLVLNGPLVRLGNAQDLVRERADKPLVGITLAFRKVPQDKIRQDDDQREEDFHAIYGLAPDEKKANLYSRHLEIGLAKTQVSPLRAHRKGARRQDLKQTAALSEQGSDQHILHVKALLGEEKRPQRTYVSMQGLLPVTIVEFSKPEVISRRYAAELHELFERADNTGLHSVMRMAYLRELWSLLKDASLNDGVASRLITQLETDNKNPAILSFQLGKKLETMRSEAPDSFDSLIAAAARQRANEPWVFLSLTHPRPAQSGGLLEEEFRDRLSSSIQALTSLHQAHLTLSSRMQYLGPLRDEPRVVWSHWDELTRGLPVGARGEYSAAVLSRDAEKEIRYVAPNGDETTDSLSKAVDDWLSYLEMGDSVSARSRGKLGVALELEVNGKVRDLTSVGVGVSQALPLVVGLLRTPRGSIFVIEQPELHLHPAVQSRLADFVLWARPDLSVVVETHSEAFITRVRRRVADGSFEGSKVDIVFVDTSPEGSTSRNLGVNEFGDLSEWPEGFLLTGQDDVRAILEAGLKRVRKPENER